MATVAAVAANTTLPLALLASAAGVVFVAAGFLLGSRAGARARRGIEQELASVVTQNARLTEGQVLRQRERAGLLAVLASAQAEAQDLTHRNNALLAHLAARPAPQAKPLGRTRQLSPRRMS